MKKLLSILLAVMLLVLSMPVIAAAEGDDELPFTLAAPENVAVDWLQGGDSPTTMSFTYSLTNEMTQFFQKLAEAEDPEGFLADYGCTSIWAGVQIDWAIDDVNDPVSGWHYNKYWDGNKEGSLGYDDDYNLRTSEWDGVEIGFDNGAETVQTPWIMRGIPNDDRWNGNPDTKTPGVKEQLNPDQYTYDEENECVIIDFTKHTAYFRARYYVVTRKETEEELKDILHFSDWSETVGYGKDVKAYEPLKPGSVPKPVISGLRMTDEQFNGNPVAAYTLEVPAEVRTMATDSAAHNGIFYIETFARVKGDTEWTELTGADRDITAGERKADLVYLAKENEVIPKDTEIELRCRYYVEESGQDVFYSEWSDIITFGSDEIKNEMQETSDSTVKPGEDDKPAEKKCPVCHRCSQPLGLCIFIWIAIILLVVIVLVVIIAVSRKRKNKK